MQAWVVKYKDDEELFFNEFAKAYQKLNELGCKFSGSGSGASLTGPAMLVGPPGVANGTLTGLHWTCNGYITDL